MGRWEPGAAARLRAAAIELFVDPGFDQTTVAAIAERAGVTERTFFRHFADKREVLFDGQGELQKVMAAAVRAAPAGASPLDVARNAFAALDVDFFTDERRPYSTLRRSIIEAHPSLGEREQYKLQSLSSELATAFRERGLPEPGATLAAMTALSVFHVAFIAWTTEGETRGYLELADAAIADLKALTA